MKHEDIENIRTQLKKTQFSNLMPQRGFLTSAQNFVTIIDIDLTYESHFFIKALREDDILHFFVKNGPIKINPYQKNFIIEVEDKNDLKIINSCNFYIVEGKNIYSNNTTSFREFNHIHTKVNYFTKKIKENKVIFTIKSKFRKKLEKINSLYFVPDKDLNVVYSPKIYIYNDASIKKYNKEGYDSVLEYIHKIFKKLNLSGRLYKTRNGLRVILTDKFRDISKTKDLESIFSLFKEFMMDENFLSYYDAPEDKRLHKYLTRLTPKLKNYKYFDNSYDIIIKNIEKIDPSYFNLGQPTIVPKKYDFNKLTYENTSINPFLDSSLQILKNMIFNYLSNNNYAVCSLIKTYNYGTENKIINEYIEYHDKWTKANLINTILV